MSKTEGPGYAIMLDGVEFWIDNNSNFAADDFWLTGTDARRLAAWITDNFGADK